MRGNRRGFTLVELLVACAITAVIIVLAARAFLASSTLWNHAVARGETFREGRAAGDIISRDLGATVASPDSTTPMLLLDYHPETAEEDRVNEEVYAAILTPNPGKSALCLVGYRLVWNPSRQCYAMQRSFRESNATSASIGSGVVAFSTPEEEVAGCVWDFTVRPCEDGAAAAAYPKRSYSDKLPTWVEVRFKAMGVSSARRLANYPITRQTWGNPGDPIYQRAILPYQQSFSFRVRLQAATP